MLLTLKRHLSSSYPSIQMFPLSVQSEATTRVEDSVVPHPAMFLSATCRTEASKAFSKMGHRKNEIGVLSGFSESHSTGGLLPPGITLQTQQRGQQWQKALSGSAATFVSCCCCVVGKNCSTHIYRDSWAPGITSTEHLTCPSSTFTVGAVEGLYSVNANTW